MSRRSKHSAKRPPRLDANDQRFGEADWDNWTQAPATPGSKQLAAPPAKRGKAAPPTQLIEIIRPGQQERQNLYPLTGLNPQRLRSIFDAADSSGNLQMSQELYEEFELRSPHLHSVLTTRKLGVSGLELQITPADSTADAKRAADMCEEFWGEIRDGVSQTQTTPEEDPIVQLGDANLKGIALQQIDWQRDGLGEIYPARLVPISGRRLRVHPLTQRLALVTGDGDFTGTPLDTMPDQFIRHIYRAASGLTARWGLGQVIAFNWVLRNYAIRDWAAVSELFGMPFRYAKYQPGASAEEKAELLSMLSSMGSDGYAIFSANVDLQLLEAVNNGQNSPQQAIIEWCDRCDSKAVLGQTLTSDSGAGTDTNALGQVHDKVRGDLLLADCGAMARTLRRDLFAAAVRWNVGLDCPVPTVAFPIPERIDQVATSTALKTLTEAGMQIPQAWVGRRFGIPTPEAGEAVLAVTQPASPLGGFGQGQGPGPGQSNWWQQAANAAIPPAAHQEDALDRLTTQALAAAAPALASLSAPVRQAVLEANSYDDLRARLTALAGSTDAAARGDLEKVLEQAFAAAAVLGRAEAVECHQIAPGAFGGATGRAK